MKVHWRYYPSSRNSYASLYAACEREGYLLEPVKRPCQDITCYSINSINPRLTLREIASADCITIAGGPHATACFRECADYADYVVVGEGEYLLPHLLSHLEEKRPGVPPGIATSREYIPADSTVRLDFFPPFTRIKGYIEISRGCPFGCTYCQTPRMFGSSMRHRSIDSIVAYASRYRDKRFVTPNAFAYGSDGRQPRLDKVRALLSKITGNIYLGTFPSEVRPEFITDEALELITSYCTNTRLHFGAQSGSDAVLAAIRRGHTTAEVIRAVELCHEHGITPVVDFIVGLPFETDSDQEATARLIAEICRIGKVHAHHFIPLPGTPLAGCSPRPLIPALEHLLGSLSLHGKATGSWSDPEIRFCRTPIE